MHFNNETFEQAVSGDKLVVVDFFATWCGPCRMLGPVIEKIAEKYEGEVVVGKLDVDQEKEITRRYGVMTVPTVIFIKDGEEVERKVADMSENTYVELIEQYK